MPSGVGAAAVGISIAGYGGVDAAPIQQQTILIDAVTGALENSRKVDPYTGRYVLDTYGRVQGMNGVQQLVMLRAGTLLNSSAVRDLGINAPSGVVGGTLNRRLSDELVLALKDLLDGGLIEILDVRVERIPGTSVYHRFFKWRDLTTTNEQETQF